MERKCFVLWIHWDGVGWKSEMQTTPDTCSAPTKSLRSYFDRAFLDGEDPIKDCGWKRRDFCILPVGKTPKPRKRVK